MINWTRQSGKLDNMTRAKRNRTRDTISWNRTHYPLRIAQYRPSSKYKGRSFVIHVPTSDAANESLARFIDDILTRLTRSLWVIFEI